MDPKRYAVLTGASRGIGRALALELAPRGWDLAICSRSEEKLEALRAELADAAPGATVHVQACDVGDPAVLGTFATAVRGWFPHVDALVHNAGVFRLGSLLEEPEGQLEELIDVNLLSAYRLTRALVPDMVRRGAGDVVTLCSVASLKAYPAGGSYGIAKHALLGFTRNLREELRESGVRVTAVMPGATWTDSWSGVEGLSPERLMPAEDIAAAIRGALELSPRTVVEELVLRPQLGDL